MCLWTIYWDKTTTPDREDFPNQGINMTFVMDYTNFDQGSTYMYQDWHLGRRFLAQQVSQVLRCMQSRPLWNSMNNTVCTRTRMVETKPTLRPGEITAFYHLWSLWLYMHFIKSLFNEIWNVWRNYFVLKLRMQATLFCKPVRALPILRPRRVLNSHP